MTTLLGDHKLNLGLVFAGAAGIVSVVTGNAPNTDPSVLGALSNLAIIPVGLLAGWAGMQGIQLDPNLEFDPPSGP